MQQEVRAEFDAKFLEASPYEAMMPPLPRNYDSSFPILKFNLKRSI